MHDLQRAGGIAGLVAAATYLFGMAMLFTLLVPAGYDPEGPSVDFAVGHTGLLILWNVVIYPVNAVALIALTLALGERLKPGAPGLSKLAVAHGLIWAALVFAAGMAMVVGLKSAAAVFATDPEGAAQIFQVAHLIENGVGGGVELAGGIWAIYVAIAALRGGTLPRLLALFGLVLGVAGVLTLIPAAAEAAGALFGLGFIIWFAWAGVVLLRAPAG